MSLQRFVGKVAVVTGASSGIGEVIAEELVKQGVIVAGLARRLVRIKRHALELSGEKGKLHPYQCDLSKQDEILETFKKITTELGPIHILINNAAIILQTNIIDGDIEKLKPVLDTNVLALTVCTREAIASMKAHNLTGHIININSVSGHVVVDYPLMGLYSASKYAVTALTETVRLEINREKLPIKITSLSPGFVKTGAALKAMAPEIAATFKARGGLETKDISDAVLYILGTPAHVNVQELIVTVQGEFA